MAWQASQALLQNLTDAGCDTALIARFCTLCQAGQIPEGLALLDRHRRVLLDRCHDAERQIACLDYLVYQMTHPES